MLELTYGATDFICDQDTRAERRLVQPLLRQAARIVALRFGHMHNVGNEIERLIEGDDEGTFIGTVVNDVHGGYGCVDIGHLFPKQNKRCTGLHRVAEFPVVPGPRIAVAVGVMEQAILRLGVVVRPIGGADDRQGRLKGCWVTNSAGVVDNRKFLIVNPKIEKLEAPEEAPVGFGAFLDPRDDLGTQGMFNRGFYEDTSSDGHELGYPCVG